MPRVDVFVCYDESTPSDPEIYCFEDLELARRFCRAKPGWAVKNEPILDESFVLDIESVAREDGSFQENETRDW